VTRQSQDLEACEKLPFTFSTRAKQAERLFHVNIVAQAFSLWGVFSQLLSQELLHGCRASETMTGNLACPGGV
jgi:hypothetical protein